MKYLITASMFFIALNILAQSKIEYLKKNRYDLDLKNFNFPQTNFNVIGFGAYHGSAKTEDVELKLLKNLMSKGIISYYIPETDIGIAYYFNQYLQKGDTLLLKNLVINFGERVPQDRSIQTYEKWKKIKKLNDSLSIYNKIKVLGLDPIVNYKYVTKLLVAKLDKYHIKTPELSELRNMIKLDTTDFSPYYKSYSKKILKKFMKNFHRSSMKNIQNKEDAILILNVLHDLTYSFGKKMNRDKEMYKNYLFFKKFYDFKNKKQFFNLGFSHLEKSREGKNGYPYFFTRLIENNIYKKDKVISVIGYLTKSRVLWILYDKNGNYKGTTTKGGYGIGDYEKEYFRGIKNLKNTKLSDETLFRLNKKPTPYAENTPDLIEIIMKDEKSNGKAVKGISTIDFLDYAVLISHSKANLYMK